MENLLSITRIEDGRMNLQISPQMCIRDRLYSVGRELALWEKAWTLRNALFGLSTLAMLTALLGLPFLYRASQYKRCV